MLIIKLLPVYFVCFYWPQYGYHLFFLDNPEEFFIPHFQPFFIICFIMYNLYIILMTLNMFLLWNKYWHLGIVFTVKLTFPCRMSSKFTGIRFNLTHKFIPMCNICLSTAYNSSLNAFYYLILSTARKIIFKHSPCNFILCTAHKFIPRSFLMHSTCTFTLYTAHIFIPHAFYLQYYSHNCLWFTS